jgi:hypothetical protein
VSILPLVRRTISTLAWRAYDRGFGGLGLNQRMVTDKACYFTSFHLTISHAVSLESASSFTHWLNSIRCVWPLYASLWFLRTIRIQVPGSARYVRLGEAASCPSCICFQGIAVGMRRLRHISSLASSALSVLLSLSSTVEQISSFSFLFLGVLLSDNLRNIFYG